jgi:hypothetical protein
VPPTTAICRTQNCPESATVNVRLGSSAGIAELGCNGALAVSVIEMSL